MAVRYEDARATEKTVLLPMTENEAQIALSLWAWAMNEFTPNERVDAIAALHARLRTLIPSPGPTIIQIGGSKQ